MRNTYLQLLRHLIAGSFAFIIHFSCLTFLVEKKILSDQIANAAAYMVAFVFSYIIQVKWVFACKQKIKNDLARYFISQFCCSFLLNQGLFSLLFEYSALHYQLVCFIACALVAGITFVMNKFWVFKQ